jgi:hypothetical protein
MSKTFSPSLTPSLKTSIRQRTVLACLDAVTAHRKNLTTLAGLLELCGDGDGMLIRPEIIRTTGTLMLEEIDQMQASLRRLEGLTLRGEDTDRNEK